MTLLLGPQLFAACADPQDNEEHEPATLDNSAHAELGSPLEESEFSSTPPTEEQLAAQVEEHRALEIESEGQPSYDPAADSELSTTDAPADFVTLPLVRGPQPTDANTRRAGAFSVRSYTSGYRNGPNFADATIFYPSNAEPPFAMVAVVPGFVSPQSSIRAWGPFLASHGFVAMTIGTNSGFDDPRARAAALTDALTSLAAENSRSGSPLNGRLDTSRRAVMGWSMGGGGSLIAATANPNLKAAISLCGWASGTSFANDRVPSLMFAATGDRTASPTQHSNRFYQQIPATTSKTLFTVQGGTHSTANNPANVSGLIGQHGLAWLKVFVEEDTRYRQFLTRRPSGLANFQTTVR